MKQAMVEIWGSPFYLSLPESLVIEPTPRTLAFEFYGSDCDWQALVAHGVMIRDTIPYDEAIAISTDFGQDERSFLSSLAVGMFMLCQGSKHTLVDASPSHADYFDSIDTHKAEDANSSHSAVDPKVKQDSRCGSNARTKSSRKVDEQPEEPYDPDEGIRRHGTTMMSSMLKISREAIGKLSASKISKVALMFLLQFLAMMLVDNSQFYEVRPVVARWARNNVPHQRYTDGTDFQARGYLIAMDNAVPLHQAYTAIAQFATQTTTLSCNPRIGSSSLRWFERYYHAFLYLTDCNLDVVHGLQPEQAESSAAPPSPPDISSGSDAEDYAHQDQVMPDLEPRSGNDSGIPDSDYQGSPSRTVSESAGNPRQDTDLEEDVDLPRQATSWHGGHSSSQRTNKGVSSTARSRKRLIVDVFSGMGAFLIAHSLYGIVPHGAIENDELCQQILSSRYPGIHMAGDVYDQQWRSWTSEDVRVLTGGPACTPYSRAGRQRHGNDPVSSQVSYMAELAKHFQPDIVIIENVPQLLEASEVYNDAVAAFRREGYALAMQPIIKHHKIGGSSTRARVFLWFERVAATRSLAPVRLVFDEAASTGQSLQQHLLPPEQVPADSALEGNVVLFATPTVNEGGVSMVGTLEWTGGQQTLQHGSLIKLRGSSSRWRVMQDPDIDGVHVMRDNRKYPHHRRVSIQDVVTICLDKIPIYSIEAMSKSVRASGEYPVRTVMLIHDTRMATPVVRPLEPAEVWSLMELEAHELEVAASLGATRSQLYRLAGNSIPSSMLRIIAEAVASRLDQMDAVTARSAHVYARVASVPGASSRTPTTIQASHTVVVPVYTLGSELQVLMPPEGHFAVVQHATTDSRAQSVKKAAALLHQLAPADEFTMVGEYESSEGYIVRVVVVAFANPPPIEGDLVTIDRISDPAAAASAIHAVHHVAKLLATPPDSLPSTAIGDAFRVGARQQKRLKTTPIASRSRDDLWDDVQASAAADRQDLRDALTAAAKHELRRGHASLSDYLSSWVDRVSEPPLSEVTPSLRNSLGTYDDPRLDMLPFCERCIPPITDSLPRQPNQVAPTGFHPTSLRDLLEDVVLDELIPAWCEAQLRDLASYRLQGPAADRTHNRVLAIGQDMFKPHARGIIWDLRRMEEGIIEPLDFSKPIDTHLNLRFLRKHLSDFPDQELLSFLLEGIQFKADLEAQIVLIPHLISLSHGYDSVKADLVKLAAKGWYGLFKHLPFLPIRCQPAGSVPRKLEERWRRVMEAGAPRKLVFDTAGLSVVPLNRASQGDRSFQQGSDEHARHLQQQSTGDYGERRPSQWPPELKPRVSDYMHDTAILSRAARTLRQPLFCWGDDVSNFFHQ